ncbi:MAG: type IV secretion system protein, partial [Selenomonadaceae bacterium]|nr:type IV secretion system protein [Selenomonadaceae bacterium]
PADYLSGVPKGSTTPALDSARAKLKWDKEHDFGKPLFDIVKQVIDLLTESTKRISDTMQKLLFILLTIDLALAASLYTINPNANNQQYGIFGFLINKLLIYSILIWLVSNWSGFIFNTMRDFAVYSAGTALSAKNEELIKFIQDPFDILVKGIHIISPFFESAVMMALGDPISIICFCMMLTMGFVLAVIFFFISYNIAMAFIGFYFSCLFGFCTLFLSGFKHTRHHAEQGINGIFYATIKLLVFSFAGFIILGLMKEFAVDPFVKQEMTTTSIVIPTDGNFGGEEGVTVVAEMIRLRETGGSEEGYRWYNVRGDLGGKWSGRFEPYEGDGGYGAWQFTGMDKYGNTGLNFENWAKEYEAEHGENTLDRISAGNDPENSPNKRNGKYLPLTKLTLRGSPSGFSYCPENQRKVAEFMLLKKYKQYGNWKDVIASWNPGDPDYYNKVINGASGTIHRPQASVVFDFYIIFKLFVIALIFVYLFSKLNKTLESLLGGNGFRFTVRDFE